VCLMVVVRGDRHQDPESQEDPEVLVDREDQQPLLVNPVGPVDLLDQVVPGDLVVLGVPQLLLVHPMDPGDHLDQVDLVDLVALEDLQLLLVSPVVQGGPVVLEVQGDLVVMVVE